MVEKVCQLLRQWIDEGYQAIPIAINQSKLVLYEIGYVKNLCGILDRYNIPASLITLEILEEIAIENVDDLNKKLTELRDIGFKISMDDFGTGYSSLNTLGKLNIDELKLDRSFLVEIKDTRNQNARLIMEEIVQLSKKLSIFSVIEGVETSEDDLLVKEIGCDMVADTTEQYLLNQSEKEQIERLKLKANTDELTGLYNRYYCKTHINEYLQEVPQGQQAVFLLIDLDNFKNLNDSLGHLAGDQALVDVANVLKNSFCDDAIISRFGGDEFVVFVKNIQDIKLFNRLISRLLQQLDLYYQSEKDQINIQASIGIALAPIDGRDMNTLYLKADKALYQAKEGGKNRYKYYNN